MGYKNFQSVRSIILPFVVAIAMTAAEYKDEYGIDVNTLDMYDKIFVKGEDGVTVPVLAVDKENKILYTADKAFSYDDEFKELSDSLVNEMIGGGDIENAKPIYFHGLDIYITGYTSITAFILNNNSEAINNTTKLKQWFASISGQVDLACNGVYKHTNELVYDVIRIRKTSSNEYKLFYKTENGYSSLDIDWTGMSVIDSVNKIN